jgi:hypothetical protein
LCESSGNTWYEGGIWYKISNVGLLAFYENFNLNPLEGYEFNWRYSLLGNCEDTGDFCFGDDDCSESICVENSFIDSYLPKQKSPVSSQFPSKEYLQLNS